MQEYEITKDGFGIHTFELKISYMEKKEMDDIMERVSDESSNRIYEGKHHSLCVHTKYPCLRVFLNQKKHKRYIRVIVTANKVLYPQANYLSILNENDDIALLGKKLNGMLTDIFGEEYGLERFNLSRIDCCVNVMLSKDFSAERYVKLISRSMLCTRDKIEKFDENADEKNKARNKHSFRVKTDFGSFTAYDKYFQLEDINVDFEAVSDALLRLELEYDRRHINSIMQNNNMHSNVEALAFYLKNSRNNFEKFISSRFHKGRYCTVKKMRETVENSELKNCEKQHAIKHIKSQCYLDHFCDIVEKSKEKLKSELAFYNMLSNFERLGMSPVSLSYRDKHGDDSVPSLYELLEIA